MKKRYMVLKKANGDIFFIDLRPVVEGLRAVKMPVESSLASVLRCCHIVEKLLP